MKPTYDNRLKGMAAEASTMRQNGAPEEAIVDRLADMGASWADALQLYAGRWPSWADSALTTRGILLFLRAVEPDVAAACASVIDKEAWASAIKWLPADPTAPPPISVWADSVIQYVPVAGRDDLVFATTLMAPLTFTGGRLWADEEGVCRLDRQDTQGLMGAIGSFHRYIGDLSHDDAGNAVITRTLRPGDMVGVDGHGHFIPVTEGERTVGRVVSIHEDGTAEMIVNGGLFRARIFSPDGTIEG